MSRIIAILVLLSVLIGALVYSKQRHEPLHVSGFVEAHEIRVGSRVGGRVAVVAASEGDVVSSGALLVALEPYDLPDRRDQAAAQLAAAEANLAKLTAGFRPEEIAQAEAQRDQLAARLAELKAGPRPQEIQAARAQVAAAEAARDLAQSDYDRISALREKSVASQEQLDQATQQRRSAEAALRARQQDLALLEAGTRPEQLAQAQAQLAQAEAQLRLERSGYRAEDIAAARAQVAQARGALAAVARQLDELAIRAPSAGSVEAVDLRPGDLVSAGAPVLSLMELSELWVRAFVPENHLDLKTGQRVWVSVDSYPGRRFAATVTFIASQAEFTPSNVQTPEDRAKQVFRIKATLDPKAAAELRPGMIADVWLEGAPPAAGESVQ